MTRQLQMCMLIRKPVGISVRVFGGTPKNCGMRALAGSSGKNGTDGTNRTNEHLDVIKDSGCFENLELLRADRGQQHPRVG